LTSRTIRRIRTNPPCAVLAAVLALAALAGCSERETDGLPLWSNTVDPVVFADDFGRNVDFQAFLGSRYDALSVDTQEAYLGTASLKVSVPGPGAQDGTFAGGAFTTYNRRDLTDYNALTFYAKASMDVTLNEAGFGNDNTGTSLYTATRWAIPLTTDWAFVVIPIPLAAKLTGEGGLFYFAEGYENNTAFDLWFDEVQFTRLTTLDDPRPFMATETQDGFVGGTVTPRDTQVTFAFGGSDLVVTHMPSYLTFLSSDETVAVPDGGSLQIVGDGIATVTAQLDTFDVAGALTINALAPPSAPAPAPTLPAVDVLSLFSDAYVDVPVDSWNTHWTYSTAVDTDFSIAGDDVKVYTKLNFVGIDFSSQTVDAAGMTHFHLDVWAPAGTNFKVKIIAFNATGQFVGEAELAFDATTTPAFTAGSWSALEIPLADFQLAAPRDHLAQLVLSSDDARTVFVDNVYFHR
jgi:hypothetical protein